MRFAFRSRPRTSRPSSQPAISSRTCGSCLSAPMRHPRHPRRPRGCALDDAGWCALDDAGWCALDDAGWSPSRSSCLRSPPARWRDRGPSRSAVTSLSRRSSRRPSGRLGAARRASRRAARRACRGAGAGCAGGGGVGAASALRPARRARAVPGRSRRPRGRRRARIRNSRLRREPTTGRPTRTLPARSRAPNSASLWRDHAVDARVADDAAARLLTVPPGVRRAGCELISVLAVVLRVRARACRARGEGGRREVACRRRQAAHVPGGPHRHFPGPEQDQFTRGPPSSRT